jgi:exonuclease VII small subunit
LDKAELLARVAEKPDLWDSKVMEFARAKEYANQLAAIIENAEMRLAVLLDDAEGEPAA